jgi:hypothetical protein
MEITDMGVRISVRREERPVAIALPSPDGIRCAVTRCVADHWNRTTFILDVYWPVWIMSR